MPDSMKRLVVLAVAAGGLLAGCASGGGGGSVPEGASRMVPSPDFMKPGEERTFRVTYTGKVKDVPAGAKMLRVWMPVPRDTPLQSIRGVEFSAPAPAVHSDERFGNRYAYYEIANPTPAMEFTMAFTCTRRELLTDLPGLAAAGEGAESDPAAATFRKDDRLTIVDNRIRSMADQICFGKATTMEKARAIYDYVAGHMTYDKTGTGWGRGDTNFACDAGKGNCTDFHALFMSLCRAEGISAGFEIGLYAPYAKHSEDKLGGYHCWSYFRVPGRTWVPVDISEADKNPDRMEYFFGGHTDNRVTMSVGRDLVLVSA